MNKQTMNKQTKKLTISKNLAGLKVKTFLKSGGMNSVNHNTNAR